MPDTWHTPANSCSTRLASDRHNRHKRKVLPERKQFVIRKPKSNPPTYSAFYQYDHTVIVYRNKPNDGTLDKLPQKAAPADDPRSTYFRVDGGDKFEWALFRTELGQLIVVQRD